MVKHVVPQSHTLIKIAFYTFLIIILNTLHLTLSIRIPNYLVLDLIKIYGRLSQKSKIGHIIPLKNDDMMVSRLINPEKFYWENIFENDDEELNFDQFAKRISSRSFEWPLMINKNRRDSKQPFYIPICHDKKMKLMRQLPIKKEMNNNKLLQLNEIISKEEIDRDAIADVFETFASSEILTKKSFSDRIKSYSPLLTLWDWDSFLRNMNHYR